MRRRNSVRLNPQRLTPYLLITLDAIIRCSESKYADGSSYKAREQPSKVGGLTNNKVDIRWLAQAKNNSYTLQFTP